MTFFSCLILSVLVVWFLFRPHLLLNANDSVIPENIDRNALYDEKNRHLQVLHDLELDYATSKISDEDYQQNREAVMAELGEVLKLIDNLK